MHQKTAFLGALIILAFVSGWVVNGWRWERDKAQFEAQANQKALEQNQSMREIERGLQTLANLTSSSLKKDYDSVNQKYRDALKRISDFERMQHNDSDSANPMPKASTITARACEPCRCQSPAANAGRVAKSLEIAKDCDLLAVRFNQLQSFYERIRTQSQQKN